MDETVTERILREVRAHPEGIRQRKLALLVGTSPAWIRQRCLVLEKLGMLKVYETNEPFRMIMVYPIEQGEV